MSSNKAISNLERNISNRTTTKNVSINNAHLVNANEKKDSISVVTKSLMASKSKKEHMIGTSPRPNSSGKIHKTSIHQEDMTDSLSDQLTPKQSSGKKTNAEQKSICCTSSSQRTYTPTRNNKSISKISNEEIKSKRCILSTKTKIPGQDKSGKQETFQNKYDTNVKSKPVHSPRFIKKNLVIDNSPNLRSTPESTEIRSNTICDKIKLNNSTQENTLKQISPVKNKQKFPNLSENLPSLSKRGHFENKFKSTQLNSAVSVYVRVRPFTNRESLLTDIYNIISVEDNSITVRTEAGNAYHFSFDSCISPNTSNTEYDDQEFTYNKIAVPLLDHALEGYNICLFAYGQTGSGKSYSMMGTAENPGIIPRFCKQLFSCTSRAENKIDY
ncbi:kinesin-like protein KIN-14I [Centruroides sculpturatus]|uniref:kinesin-like protein KIN-14I n=1 Tax=Centruroides sculpturatus TaxID=218467 RepID=UPI000C6E8B48|nr:kinesin-like protein KIN-14I [Centruroides sculpturatus]